MRRLTISLCIVAVLLAGSLPFFSTSISLNSQVTSYLDVQLVQAQDRHEFRTFLPIVPNNYQVTVETANPNASADAKKLLNYLAQLPYRSDNRVISGQNIIATSLGNTPNGYRNYVVSLYEATGKWVGVIGINYGWGSTLAEMSIANRTVIDHWNNGGLVTIHHHVNNPWTGGNCQDLRYRNFIELINPTTDFNRAAHDRWMAELDKVAAGLAELRDAGVVVLWRPFHEMTFNNTFWWNIGAHPGNPEPFKNMWRHMFNYFTYEKGLDNLLWVYATANSDTYNSVDCAYPGDEYVDMVGVDVYADSPLIRGSGYEKLVATGKPFALAEFGPQTKDGSYDNRETINGIKARYPKTVYFLYWQNWNNYKVAIVDNRNASGLLNDPWVITRDELDWKPDSLEFIVDNTDAGFSTISFRDVWQEHVRVGGQHYGDSHHYNEQIGSGQDTATWSFTVPQPGNYDVYAWWWEGDFRPFDVPYTVHHFETSTTVRVDQRSNGGQWNLLGTFYFQDTGSVVVSDDVSSGQDVVADAIRLVYR